MAIWRFYIFVLPVLALTQAGAGCGGAYAEIRGRREATRTEKQIREQYRQTCAEQNKTAVGQEFDTVLFVNNQVVVEDWNAAPTACFSWETACPTISAALGKLERQAHNQTVLLAVAATLRPYKEPVLCSYIRRKHLVVRGGYIPYARCEEDWDSTYTTPIHLSAARNQSSAVSVQGFNAHVTMSNFVWQSEGRPIRIHGRQTRVHFQNCVFYATPLWAFDAQEVRVDSSMWIDSALWLGGKTEKVVIEDCTLQQGRGHGLGFMQADEVTIRNTIIKNNAWTTGAYPGLFFSESVKKITLDRVSFVGNRIVMSASPKTPLALATVMWGQNIKQLRHVRFFNNTDGKGKSLTAGVYAHDLGQYLLQREPPLVGERGAAEGLER